MLFADAGVDVAVVEVGLGGRFDATNVVTPAVTAITSIDFDHERHLGNTLAAIAAEKAGIAKAGVPLVVGALPDEAREVVTQAADAAGAPLVSVPDTVATTCTSDAGHAVLRLTTPVRAYPPVRLGLAGRHQAGNAAVAVRVLEVLADVSPLRSRRRGRGRRLARRALAGAARVAVPAVPTAPACWSTPRTTRPAPGHWRPTSTRPEFPRSPSSPRSCRTRTSPACSRPLLPHAARVVATRAASPRATAAADAGRGHRPARRAWPGGDRRGRSMGAPSATRLDDARPVVIAGSIFLVGPLRDALLTRGGFEPA